MFAWTLGFGMGLTQTKVQSTLVFGRPLTQTKVQTMLLWHATTFGRHTSSDQPEPRTGHPRSVCSEARQGPSDVCRLKGPGLCIHEAHRTRQNTLTTRHARWPGGRARRAGLRRARAVARAPCSVARATRPSAGCLVRPLPTALDCFPVRDAPLGKYPEARRSKAEQRFILECSIGRYPS